MLYLAIFGMEFEKKKHCHILNQHPRHCLIAKFCEMIKMSKFGTNNISCGYFWSRNLKYYCDI